MLKDPKHRQKLTEDASGHESVGYIFERFIEDFFIDDMIMIITFEHKIKCYWFI